MAGRDPGEFLDHPRQAVDAQPDLEPAGAEIEARDQQLQHAGVLGRESSSQSGSSPASAARISASGRPSISGRAERQVATTTSGARSMART